MQSEDLFADSPQKIIIDNQLVFLRHYLLKAAPQILDDVRQVNQQSPARQMQTPGGKWMSAKITNCGHYGWVTDQQGYRYTQIDPLTCKPWPVMPERFFIFASQAATEAGFHNFFPDVCLINHYQPGCKMGLHQDRDEQDFSQPIVSVSLGLPVTFQFGGKKRSDPKQNIRLEHGDVLIWSGQQRLNYHGVLTLKPGWHPLTGRHRINLTFRQAH